MTNLNGSSRRKFAKTVWRNALLMLGLYYNAHTIEGLIYELTQGQDDDAQDDGE